MIYKPISFAAFKGREDALKNIQRFAPYKPMFYRSSLLRHSRRVSYMVEEMSEYVQEKIPSFNTEKARTLALVHDDPELITGDVQACYKIRMTDSERKELHNQEAEAIEILAQRWPYTVNGFSYKELLIECQIHTTPESIIMTLADKVDAWCESLHELHAGNREFHSNTIETTGLYPITVKGTTVKKLFEDYPLLKELKEKSQLGLYYTFFQPIPDINKEEILENGRIHMKERLVFPTGIPHYDVWKDIAMRRGCTHWLTDRTEF